MAYTMADLQADMLREEAAHLLATPDDWHRIRDEHRDEPIADRMRRERDTFDRTVRARGDYSLPSDRTTYEQQLADEARPSAFGHVREQASERDASRFWNAYYQRPTFGFDAADEVPFVMRAERDSFVKTQRRFTSIFTDESTIGFDPFEYVSGVPDEPHPSTRPEVPFEPWLIDEVIEPPVVLADWQRDLIEQMAAAHASTERMREAMFGAFGVHPPEEERAEQPDSGDKKPEQRVWDGPFPTELHFAGVVGRPMVITERDLMEEQDLPEQLEHFQHVASIHAPWVEIRALSYPQDPIEIGYVRPSLTSLPA